MILAGLTFGPEAGRILAGGDTSTPDRLARRAVRE